MLKFDHYKISPAPNEPNIIVGGLLTTPGNTPKIGGVVAQDTHDGISE